MGGRCIPGTGFSMNTKMGPNNLKSPLLEKNNILDKNFNQSGVDFWLFSEGDFLSGRS